MYRAIFVCNISHVRIFTSATGRAIKISAVKIEKAWRVLLAHGISWTYYIAHFFVCDKQ